MNVQESVDAVYTDLSNIPSTRSQQQLQSAIVVVDNRTGDVVALSGGVGEKDTFLGYNKATQAKLQTGSSQKPISVYAPAFEKGVVSPATVLKDLPVFYADNGGWPKNDNRQYQNGRTVFSGVVNSINTVSVRTLDMVGYDYAYSFAKYNLGQSGLTDYYALGNGQSMNDLDRAPLALGALTLGSTVRDMSAAYATFANDGVYREARLYTKVYNSDGQIVLDNTQETRKVLSDKTVNYMNYTLYNAANNGTGGAAIFNGQMIAGKTGTTSSNRDRWFCGYTAHYTAAVWCGYNQPEEIRLTGSTANPAAVLWRKVMQPVHQGLGYEGLYNGNVFQTVSVCLDSGLLATEACSHDARGINRVSTVNVYPEDAPTEYCDRHVDMTYCVTGGAVATEFCGMFEDSDVQTRSLVYLNQAEVTELKEASYVGLSASHTHDGYVYFLGDDGQPAPWSGFYGGLGSELPYAVCSVHSKEAYDQIYQDFGGIGSDENDRV